MQWREQRLNFKGKEIERLLWFFQETTRKSRRKEKRKKKRKKEKLTFAKPDWIAIHMPPRKEENAEKNQMMLWKHDYYHQSQPHESPEGEGTAHALKHIKFFLILFWKRQKCL